MEREGRQLLTRRTKSRAEPHVVGQESESRKELMLAPSLGHEKSWIWRQSSDPLGTRPSGLFWKGPRTELRAEAEIGPKYRPAETSAAMMEEMIPRRDEALE